MSQPNKKIAFLSTMGPSPWGGSEELWSLAAFRLLEKGYEVGVIYRDLDPCPQRLLDLQKAGAELMLWKHDAPDLPTQVIRRITGNHLKYLTSTVPVQPKEQLEAYKPDLLIISQGGAIDGTTWMLQAKAMGIPYASIAQAYCDFNWPDDGQAARTREAYESAQTAFFIAHQNKADLEMHLGIDLPQAQVVWNPFNVQVDNTVAWPDTSDATGYRLASVARLEPREKSQDVLFRVMAQKKWKERPLSISLYGNGACAEGLKRFAQKLELNNVHFKNHVSNIEQIWEEHHGLILPSRAEGFPLALAEAFFCRRMAITTNITDHHRFVETGKTGFLVEAPTFNLLDASLELAWEQREHWKAYGENARQRIVENYSTDPPGAFTEAIEKIV